MIFGLGSGASLEVDSAVVDILGGEGVLEGAGIGVEVGMEVTVGFGGLDPAGVWYAWHPEPPLKIPRTKSSRNIVLVESIAFIRILVAALQMAALRIPCMNPGQHRYYAFNQAWLDGLRHSSSTVGR